MNNQLSFFDVFPQEAKYPAFNNLGIEDIIHTINNQTGHTFSEPESVSCTETEMGYLDETDLVEIKDDNTLYTLDFGLLELDTLIVTVTKHNRSEKKAVFTEVCLSLEDLFSVLKEDSELKKETYISSEEESEEEYDYESEIDI